MRWSRPTAPKVTFSMFLFIILAEQPRHADKPQIASNFIKSSLREREENFAGKNKKRERRKRANGTLGRRRGRSKKLNANPLVLCSSWYALFLTIYLLIALSLSLTLTPPQLYVFSHERREMNRQRNERRAVSDSGEATKRWGKFMLFILLFRVCVCVCV